MELTRSFNRKVLVPGTLKGGFKEDGKTPADDADDLVATDLSSEDADVKAVAEAAWGIGTVKADYKAFLIANKSNTP